MKIIRPQSNQLIPENAKKVFSGKIFDVYQYEIENYDGKTVIFEKLKRADTVMIIASTDNKLIIEEQEQPGKEMFKTIPSGRVDLGEETLDAAKRELKEETGYESNNWDILFSHQPTGKIDWAIYFLIAKDCIKTGEQDLDGGERINLKYYSFDEFLDLVNDKRFRNNDLIPCMLKAKYDKNEYNRLKTKIL